MEALHPKVEEASCIAPYNLQIMNPMHQTRPVRPHLLRPFLHVVVAMALFGSFNSFNVAMLVPVQGAGYSPRKPSDEPEECVTRSVFYPREPGWVFVMNFEKFDQGQPVGCLKLLRSTATHIANASDYKAVPCKVISNGSDIAFRDGMAELSGGYLYCPLNIRQALAALDPPVTVPAEEKYRYYTIIARAAISFTNVVTTYSHPVAYYQPNTNASPDHGLFLPSSQNGVNMTSLFNDQLNVSFTNTLSLDVMQTYIAKHDASEGSSGEVLTITHEAGKLTLAEFGPRERMKMWLDGGAFWVGASARDLDNRFYGTLDEVIFDPPDTGRPPANVMRVRAWLPLVQTP
jgi:hypothetical protein